MFQAGLYLCCSHASKSGFLVLWPVYAPFSEVILCKLKCLDNHTLHEVNNKGADQTVCMFQAGLYLCCSYASKSGFLVLWPVYATPMQAKVFS